MLLLGWTVYASAQQTKKYPLEQYEELTDNKPHDSSKIWSQVVQPRFAWGSIDVRYPKKSVPKKLLHSTKQVLRGWKGERVHAQAVLYTANDLHQVQLETSALTNGNHTIPATAISTYFVRYVMTDELNKDGKGGCGKRPFTTEWDSSLVADVLDITKQIEVKACTTQPIWLKIRIPSDIKAGIYKGHLTVRGNNLSPQTLAYQIEIVDRLLPPPPQWTIHLDLWQNPYSVARYHEVELWSKANFDAMRPIMKMLADAGQKVITTSIMHKPWAGQTQDHFDSMITRIKKVDGSWFYDYAVFDKWVEFMMNEIGIRKQINCYTIIPWNLQFDYYDEATNRILFINTKPGDSAYNDYWGAFLKDFSKHLRKKGWFEKTTIAMDERPMEAMQEAISVIKQADPAFKISLAGKYHDELEADLYDLCIPYTYKFPDKVKAERRRQGKVSTFYTCCKEAFPNTFTFSQPVEATWTLIHTAAADYDGYLRWSFNSWTEQPLQDSRFRSWAAGDCYSIYPGPRSSIRFERLVEGVQAFEKIRILKTEFCIKNAHKKQKQLERLLSGFMPGKKVNYQKIAPQMVKELHDFLNQR